MLTLPIPNLVESALELFKAEILKEFLVICKKNNFGENSEKKRRAIIRVSILIKDTQVIMYRIFIQAQGSMEIEF